MKHNYTELVESAKRAAENVEHPWDRVNLDWPLSSDSVVWEVGSYKGRWAYQIAQRHNPQLYCFEPQSWAAETARQLLDGYDAQVYGYALGIRTGLAMLSNYYTDGGSLTLGTKDDVRVVDMVEISGAMRQLKVKRIDLMLMNIEGYERFLLPHMFNRRIFPTHLSVQCHGEDMRPLIETWYDSLWDYGLTLSGWQLRDAR